MWNLCLGLLGCCNTEFGCFSVFCWGLVWALSSFDFAFEPFLVTLLLWAGWLVASSY